MSTRTCKISLKGSALLNDPQWNKGSAFTDEERRMFNLRGRLPCRVNTLEEQIERAYAQLNQRESAIRKNSFLESLKTQNWVLYFALLQKYLKELMPIVYTPTEAEAIANYSHLFRRSEGLYLSFPNADTMEEDFLDQIRGRNIDLVVVSDAEAILGIGDQGCGGIGISTAKAVIYTLVGGVDPARSLPVALDVGTDNEQLLNDPLYIGWRNKRIRGREYDEFVDKFVQLVRKYLPDGILHFEDFGVTNAQRLLDLYRDEYSVFNDDVQGTGAVTLAALMSAVGITKTKLSDQTIVVYGAGSAGLGIARQVRDAMVILDGLDKEEATKRFHLVDKDGLVTVSIVSQTNHAGWAEFQRSDEEGQNGASLLDVVKHSKATVLIGTSTHAGGFTEEVVREMAKNNKHPIILPLSNPSRLVEAEPKDIIKWSDGRALIATGSPFDACDLPNGGKAIIAECNNALIYPGIGMGSILSRSKKVSDGMLIAATRKLAELSPALKSQQGASGNKGEIKDAEGDLPPLLPDFADAPDTNFEVAVAVAQCAIDEGLARIDFPVEELRAKAQEAHWRPVYPLYEFDPKGYGEP
ncbi:NAD-dependent malic enzyme, mitochondrial Short=NAD-ME; Flags: Precursor [Serendipita indica DSM 11827]|uniref:Malic enzyme n=1 Tax=Serendipita indica (strain DSM 11827) TaxID=1109443 RepID=G4TIX8_SERID|nr:NAD-dependent malic enzyme, mitochondrial Short=NAD-ME; Flags: Precursor [Serendipita indica DSM 11827]CCA71267.1 related to MAE1-Malic enzyme [Serendipita indica DSM 11827]